MAYPTTLAVCLPWPYAAKAIAEFEYDDILQEVYVWLTFRFPMNMTLYPLPTKWVPSIDGFDCGIDSQEWQDSYTLKLTVIEVTDPPSRVTIQYNGPGPLVYLHGDPARKTLETTWRKQWEPWGPILCLDITT